MSNRKTRKEKMKSQQRVLRMHEIEATKQKILELEGKVQSQRRIHFFKKHIRNLKIFGSVCNFLAPFIISSGITTGILKVFDLGYPFVQDDIEKYKKYTLEYATDGFIEMRQHYEQFTDLPESQLMICSKKEPFTDGKGQAYRRNYFVGQLDDVGVFDAILTQDIDYINDNFDYEEVIVDLEYFDFNDEDYIIYAELNMFDLEDVLIIKEDDLTNNTVTASVVFFSFLLGVFANHKRKFCIDDAITSIMNEYETSRNSLETLEDELGKMREKVLSLTKGGRYNDR